MKFTGKSFLGGVVWLCFIAFLFSTATTVHAETKRIVMIAGNPSHGRGQHEHRAGVMLFQKCLTGFPGVSVQVYSNGWPADVSVLEHAASIVIYSDGGAGHPALQGDRRKLLDRLFKQGTGFVCLHYAVEPTRENGQQEFLKWLGGCFEIHRSVNPVWTANFTNFPAHPVANGVKPFTLQDEWYFNMRFRDGEKGVTKILNAVPPADTMEREDGPHEGNPGVRAAVARGEPQCTAWASERPDGGRGFGFTGGHFHKNWGNDNVRKLVLNGILWSAKIEIPPTGVESVVTAEDLAANLDPKGRPPKKVLTSPAATPSTN